MRVAAPHIGVEPCAGAKTDVMGFPRVVVECLLTLAQHTRGRTAIEIVDLYEVAKAAASEPPRALHADGPADAGRLYGIFSGPFCFYSKPKYYKTLIFFISIFSDFIVSSCLIFNFFFITFF